MSDFTPPTIGQQYTFSGRTVEVTAVLKRRFYRITFANTRAIEAAAYGETQTVGGKDWAKGLGVA